MTKYYLRKIVVTILPPSGKVKVLDELRITFRCEKTLESNPNTCQVDIYNLSDRTRSLLEGQRTRLILEAGYGNQLETVFKGNITDVVHERQGPDIVTKVEVADGGNHFRNARIEKGLPPGAKATQVIDELIKSMDLPRGAITGIPNVQYANGITLSGFSKDRMNDVTRKLGMEWSIQNEAVQVIPRSEAAKVAPTAISPETGLIGSPTKNKEGIQFECLLRPSLLPGHKARIESQAIKGEFRLSKVAHSGDNRKNEFMTVGESKVKKKKKKAA